MKRRALAFFMYKESLKTKGLVIPVLILFHGGRVTKSMCWPEVEKAILNHDQFAIVSILLGL